MREGQDIVYREAPAARATPNRRPRPAAGGARRGARALVPNDVLLFRYSALTFNSHRIHYDRRYASRSRAIPAWWCTAAARDAAARPAAARRTGRDVATFCFRAVRPTFDVHPFQVNGDPGDDGTVRLWSQDHEGRLTMDAVATLRPRRAGHDH